MYKRNKCIIQVLGFASALFLAACDQRVGFSSTPAANQDVQDNPGVITNPIDIQDNVPACEVNIPQMELQGAVYGFEFGDSVGVTFGYNTNGNDSTGVGVNASVQVSWAQMDLSMSGVDPMTLHSLAATSVTSAQTKTNINATVNFGLFSGGPSAILSTPLGTVTLNGLTSGVAGIKTQMDKLPWVGRVLKHIDDNTLLINAGDLNGLQVGDVFTVQNVTNLWSGADCTSTYYGSVPVTEASYDVIQITALPPNQTVAEGTIIQHGSVPSEMGAQVLVSQLAAPAAGAPARYLKKNIILGQITANPLVLPGGTDFDFQTAMNQEIITVLTKQGAFSFSTP